MKHTNHTIQYASMGIFMILAGALSTMNVWADSFDDIRFSLNDIYMIILMTSWMYLFMSLYDGIFIYSILSIVGIVIVFYLIRNQVFITEKQFLLGMIPHHSMAILMSKRLSNKKNTIQPLLSSIQKAQAEEILYMKQKLADH